MGEAAQTGQGEWTWPITREREEIPRTWAYLEAISVPKISQLAGTGSGEQVGDCLRGSESSVDGSIFGFGL